MKSQSRTSTALSTRCSHRTAAGRQCRQLSATGHADPTAQDEDETESENEIESSSSMIDAKDPSANAAPTNTFSKATQGWTATIHEPDLTKKPS
ncbi:MAG TPA: hypothetical protein VKH63_02815 [Candidatus Acidoferrum sp.]|jgi:hypothetical protein|nr:hypothetical protein [Candidatus Acidoferrum sp.]